MELLLTPCRIGSCTIPNRFVMTAASLCRSPKGAVTDDVVDFYAARARGGAGLVIAGGAGVDPVRRGDTGMLELYDDRFIQPLQRLTEAVHREGGKVFLQLLHPGAYADPTNLNGLPPIAPSVYVSGLTHAQTAAMTEQDIQTVTGYFAKAAGRAKQAGFDGVELCASVGYLLAEFLSPATNRRTDRYGGALQNRMAFLLEVVDQIKAETGGDYPLIVRLSGEDCIPGGNQIADTVEIAKALEGHGVDCISVTGGWHESRTPQITGHVPHGGWLPLAKAVKDVVSIPVIGCNRLDVESSRKAITDGSCDLVGLCRPFLADPNLVQKLAAGKEKEIRPCLACNQECLDRVFAGKPVGCAVNPHIGRELSPPACRNKGKRILVVGAGISGMTYAALAARENTVTVVERSDSVGGVGNLLSALPAWADCGPYIQSLYRECVAQQVDFQFGQTVTATALEKLLAENRYDQIVIAAGGTMKQPPFPIEGQRVIPVTAFAAPAQATGRVVIIGNDFRALEFALGCRNNPSVTCIGPLKRLGLGMAKSVLWVARGQAKAQKVNHIEEATVTAVTRSGVHYRQGEREAVCPADTVILAQGWQGTTALAPSCFSEENRGRICWIGDAKGPGRITEAVRCAARSALEPESPTTPTGGAAR